MTVNRLWSVVDSIRDVRAARSQQQPTYRPS